MGLPDSSMRPHFRSAIFHRLFWSAFLATLLLLLFDRLLTGHWFLLFAAALLLSLAAAFLFSHAIDQRIARMRRFAEDLLQPDDAAGGSGFRLDQLDALDRSLLRMAGQTRILIERAKVESARREAILASMSEGVLAVDAQMRVTFCNQALARLAGTRMPASGTPLIELVRDSALHETLSEVMRTGEPAKRYLQIPAAHTRSFEVQAAPLISGDSLNGKPGAIAILHDITDIERLENVRKDFVANVSHEFRTPLAAIAGYAETLLDGALEDHDNKRRFVEIIRSNATRLNSIASDLLTLSELQTGAGPPDTDQVAVGDALESALSTIASEAKLRGVSLERGTIENVLILGSRYRLEQALVNLLANAVKFNRPSGIVRVETQRVEMQHDGIATPAGEISILVSDTGAGIPSQDLPRVFERFYRVDKARSRQVGGTGLGLSIVRHIVERMNGRVSATSQLGKGSVFTITLPIL
jgi:two-component system phosphate regulon sensor histidine kinase PhoR